MVYKIDCVYCSWSYIDGTTRAFNTRRKEHRRNVELSKSGSNIANHIWTNNYKIDFNSEHRETLESWHTACTIQNIYQNNTAFHLAKTMNLPTCNLNN
jgi:hypothetical protein